MSTAPLTVSATFTGQLTATSSIAHGGETRGTITLLRREQIIRDGALIHIPMISGNSWRGQLRRIGEELMREVLAYEGQIPLAAAHVLRGGGSLVKSSGAPLTGSRLRQVRSLVPQFAIFGGSVGRTIDGALQVGKILPHVAETQHLTGQPGPGAFSLTQVETYTRRDETASADLDLLSTPAQVPVDDDGAVDLDALAATEPARRDGTGPLFFRIETFPAGTTFSTWARVERVTPLQLAFFIDVLDRFTLEGRLGGRRAIGHGQFTATWTRTSRPANPGLPDWRDHLTSNRDAAIEAIQALA